ncbi:alpha/beta hydrolase [Photobacterium rosenbergii]|uniref:alpha/beta hydrolase n=1 Tax=Photobacterium rosenbergii TaxID=294936 RepID=UPI001C9910B8|nr:alpha/beta fold hydrolase [Photobacterium rosenbergii]MBY5944753.1 alpha/beta hydrolase [Photobacterium rosenbergii]
MYKVVVPVVVIFTLFLHGCANSLFYYPGYSEREQTHVQWLDSHSGNDLAYLWLSSKAAEPKGIIVHFHGNSGHMGETKEKVDWLPAFGYHVLAFDYSGFGFSSGAATDRALYDDARTVLELTSKLKVEYQLPVFVVATSTGGNVFLRAWADEPVELDGVIIDSSFLSYIEVTEHVLEQYFLGEWYAWISGVLMRDSYAAKTVINQIPTVKTLVVHCEEDDIVPISLGYDIYDQLYGDKEFWSLQQCKHARGITRDFPENQYRLVSWLEGATSDIEVAGIDFIGGQITELNAF